MYQVKTEAFSSSRYVPTTEICKLIRAILKAEFPHVKFSVRKDGSSISVGYSHIEFKCPVTGEQDRERENAFRKEVEAKIDFLEGEGFDGSIDMRYCHRHYIGLDGKLIYGGTNGTQGSGGHVEKVEVERPNGAIEVRLSSSFIFVQRNYN